MSEAPQSRRSSRLAAGGNVLLLLGSCAVAIAVFEYGARQRYGSSGYKPSDEVLAVQEYLRTDPVVGFTWQPGVDASAGVVFQIADVTLPPLSTDSHGFINPPAAKAERAAGTPVDVLGLGDSFMEGASHQFHERFAAAGLTYYSLAIHRQAPPQYTRAYEAWGQEMQPRYVVYGLYENDFRETQDFYAWRRSELDWFTYHSGTWCGPAIDPDAQRNLLQAWFPGVRAAYRHLARDNRPQRNTISVGQWNRVSDQLRTAMEAVCDEVTARGGTFILLTIPSKETVLRSTTREWFMNRTLADSMEAEGAVSIELLTVFRGHPSPASLYYVEDGHWNDRGIALAAETVLAHIENALADDATAGAAE